MKMNIKNMKTVWGAWICLGLLVPTACSDMFETDSTSVVFESGNRLDSPNDSLYSIMGILAQIQKLGDRYVLWPHSHIGSRTGINRPKACPPE